MNSKEILAAAVFLLGLSWFGCDSRPDSQDASPESADGYLLRPVPFNEVRLEDQFWKPRLATQLETLVPFALEKTQPAVENLRKAARYRQGDSSELPFPHRYISSDLYKVMEGASYLLMDHLNPALEQQMDSIIDIIAAAQQEDGYLYVAHITGVADDPEGMGDRPYSRVVHSHELYNMGHMYEGAIAYYQATGKDQWLRVAEKNARHINRVFFEGDPDYNQGQPVNQAPGHQELELALTKLYRVTGEELYLEMAKKFLDIRGGTYVPDGEGVMSPTYAQQHQPVAEQREAVGHAVRAAYMYSGMADVGALTGSDEYQTALNSIWHNIVDTKMSITGGLGAVHGIEGFGPSYVLPNEEAYNETCAAVGNVFFNFRMFLLTQDARYMDVAELSLLNNALAGVNLAGNKFFYVNPLAADGKTTFNHGQAGRSPWFNTACCPSNIARLMPQVSGMMYSYDRHAIYATLYGSNRTTIPLDGSDVDIQQEADYPYDGDIILTLTPPEPLAFQLKLRVPTWARTGQLVPGELYDYANRTSETWQVMLNGEPVEAELEQGFAVLDRTWEPGDRVELKLPMPVRFSTAIDSVEADRGRVAISRGPLVYCAEGIDNGGSVQQFYLEDLPDPAAITTTTIGDGSLRNIRQITVPAQQITSEGTPTDSLRLVPYYAWNNRDEGSMVVWLPTQKSMVTSN